MLPTLSKLMQDNWANNQRKLHLFVRQRSGLIGSISNEVIHEGRSGQIHRADGSVGESNVKAHGSEFEVKRTDLKAFDPALVEKLLQKMAEDFAKSATEDIIKTMQEATEKTGNVIDGRERPFHEAFLEAIEMLPASIDGDQPMFVVHPDVAARIAADKERIENDPDIQRRLREIAQKKEGERRAAKANRRLVG